MIENKPEFLARITNNHILFELVGQKAESELFTKTLRACWPQEAVDDLKTLYSIDATKCVEDTIVDEIYIETTRYVLNDLKQNAEKLTIELPDTKGITLKQVSKTLLESIHWPSPK